MTELSRWDLEETSTNFIMTSCGSSSNSWLNLWVMLIWFVLMICFPSLNLKESFVSQEFLLLCVRSCSHFSLSSLVSPFLFSVLIQFCRKWEDGSIDFVSLSTSPKFYILLLLAINGCNGSGPSYLEVEQFLPRCPFYLEPQRVKKRHQDFKEGRKEWNLRKKPEKNCSCKRNKRKQGLHRTRCCQNRSWS